MIPSYRWLAIRDLCLLFALLGCTASLRAAERVTIQLQDPGRAPGRGLVRIRDVATISGGTTRLRRKIGDLDLLQAQDVSGELRISPRQVELRILIAGVRAEEFRVAQNPYPPAERRSLEGPVQDEVLQSLVPAIARQLGVPEVDVQLRLTRPLDVDKRLAMRRLRQEVELPRTISGSSFYARVRLYDDLGQLQQRITLAMEARVRKQVLIVERRQTRGASLTVEDVRVDRRFVAPGSSLVTTADLATSGALRRDIPAGEVLYAEDFQSSSRTRRQVVVRARDLVDVIVKRRTFQVTIQGVVAMESGAVGETIRVKNPHNQDRQKPPKIFNARVVDAGRVEVR